VTRTIHRTIATLPLLLSATALLALPVSALAAKEAPVKEIVSSHFGRDVNRTKVEAGAPQAERNLCTVISKDQCQFGVQNSQAGGFLYTQGLAVNNAPALVSPEHGDVYVADQGHHRVQVFSSAGAFVEMFGWDVNRTKAEKGAPQAERNVCTAISGDVCQAGVEGGAAGQFAKPKSVVVDPAAGNVYVVDYSNYRVQEFTAAGAFILMIGKGVDRVTKGNLCTAASKHVCQAGERAAENSKEPGAFTEFVNQLAIGGPEGLLYVGDKYRVQRFKIDGTPAGEISLTSISAAPHSAVGSLAVDAAGDVYVAYSIEFVLDTIYELDPSAKEINHFELIPRRPEATAVELEAAAIALDPAGRLAVSEREQGYVEGHNFTANRGGLYEVGPSLRLLTEFYTGPPLVIEGNGPPAPRAMAFNDKGEMYAALSSTNEVLSYTPVPVAALSVKAAECKAGADNETDATIDCELKGLVNPWGVPETEMWFQWGRTPALGLETPKQPVATGETPVAVAAPLTGLLPNETYYYRLVGEDEHVKAPELLASARTSVTTAAVGPRIVGEPSVLHTGPFSAVMFGELNPENSNTEYEFRYWPCESTESCAEVELAQTEAAQSPTYGAIGTTVEVAALRSSTLYHYRLLAKSQGGEAASQAGAFTTAPGPAVSAQTGGTSSIATASALVSGTVNPDGQAASYAFELGRYNGAQTYLGIVFSGSAGAGYRPVPETLALSGLQPGTTYAYRISARSGAGATSGSTATGATVEFTTEGLPSVLAAPTPLPILAAVPSIFPLGAACKHGYKRDRHGRCVKAKRKQKSKRAGRSKR
jgi:hypothetical protein